MGLDLSVVCPVVTSVSQREQQVLAGARHLAFEVPAPAIDHDVEEKTWIFHRVFAVRVPRTTDEHLGPVLIFLDCSFHVAVNERSEAFGKQFERFADSGLVA